MLYGFVALLLFVVSGYLFFSALDRPLKPIPPGVDPIYVLVPALFVAFTAVVFTALALGASLQDVKDAVAHVMTNMFAII